MVVNNKMKNRLYKKSQDSNINDPVDLDKIQTDINVEQQNMDAEKLKPQETWKPELAVQPATPQNTARQKNRLKKQQPKIQVKKYLV
jgi:hypothetical protein